MYITPKYMHSINRSDNYDTRHYSLQTQPVPHRILTRTRLAIGASNIRLSTIPHLAAPMILTTLAILTSATGTALRRNT